MKKNILKEVIIILLLTLAIILILGVLLYEYVPVNKIIPEKISYTTPENIKTELQTDTNVDDTQVVITYQIDSTDLSNYKKIQEYVPGRKNPFESLNKKEENTTTDGTTSNSTTQSSTTTNTNSSSSSGYLPDKGTK